MLAGVLVGRGLLDPDRPIVDYLPEVQGSGYADATVRHLLDMTVGLAFDEDYEASQGDVVRYRQATGWNASGSGEPIGLHRFLVTLGKQGEHGQVFKYLSPNADLLGWILERVSGQRLAAFLSEALWAPMGAEHNAYIHVDGYGAGRMAGGLCTTTRDLARLGQLMLDGGRVGDKEVIPEGWVRDIIGGGDRNAWKGGTFEQAIPDAWYRSQWYKHGEDAAAIRGFGIYGQSVYVHRPSQMVFAKQSSRPIPLDFELDAMEMRAFEAIASTLG
jgi:CubicO group peptidase (beta-lactamase class C family)